MRNPKDKDEVLNNCDYYFEGSFDNDNPVCLEIGMGKGQFILNMALNNPNVNYIGVEKYSSVASVAIKKINEYKPNNLKVLIGDIATIEDLLDKKIDTIYLNFSDPWPKDRHEKRRLTSYNFLSIYDRHAKRRLTSINYLKVYDNLFKGKPRIIQKTDNDLLFQFSLDEYNKYGYHVNKISYDLHNEDIPNIMTEYEEKFSNMGIKIKYVDVSK